MSSIARIARCPPASIRRASLPAEGAPDVVVLGVKPQQLADAAARYAARLREAPILLSILAGVDEAVLSRAFPGRHRCR